MNAFCVVVLAMSSLSLQPAAFAQTSNAPVVPSGNFQNTQMPSAPDAVTLNRLRAQADAEMSRARLRAHATEPVCYSLRSYKFSRPEAGSDVTRPVGYSTCQKAGNFTYKQTIDPK